MAYPIPKAELPAAVMMQRVISLAQAAEISGLSRDTLKRTYRDRIITLSPRRRGMRLRDVLAIGEPEPAA